jgi:hypothetical protein
MVLVHGRDARRLAPLTRRTARRRHRGCRCVGHLCAGLFGRPDLRRPRVRATCRTDRRGGTGLRWTLAATGISPIPEGSAPSRGCTSSLSVERRRCFSSQTSGCACWPARTGRATRGSARPARTAGTAAVWGNRRGASLVRRPKNDGRRRQVVHLTFTRLRCRDPQPLGPRRQTTVLVPAAPGRRRPGSADVAHPATSARTAPWPGLMARTFRRHDSPSIRRGRPTPSSRRRGCPAQPGVAREPGGRAGWLPRDVQIPARARAQPPGDPYRHAHGR